MRAGRRVAPSLSGPIVLSALMHAAVIAAFIVFRTSAPVLMPPMYKVELVAAPAGPRAAGVVTTAPAPEAPAKAPPKAESKAAAKALPSARAAKPPTQATPNVTPKPVPAKVVNPPKAGGGDEGGRGADVATVRTEGIEFPYPGYLSNIVRQIAVNFSPKGKSGALRAEVFFMIRRDGSTAGFRFLTRSGSVAFDLECQGAVEAASRSFGPLPAGFSDDVLPVIFSFDPSKLR